MPEGPTPAPSAPPSAVAEDRLDSWKEIAAYLNHDVTTVQRWEKREGPGIVREATKLIPDFATNESSAYYGNALQ